MTIMKHDKFAFIPKRCDYCDKWFLFEPYDIYYGNIIRCVECEKRIEQKHIEKGEKNDT